MYQCPMENSTLDFKVKVQLAILTWESSYSMKIQKISPVFLISSKVLKLKTDMNCNNGAGYNNHISVHFYTSLEGWFFLNLNCHKEYTEYSQIQTRLRSVMSSALTKVSSPWPWVKQDASSSFVFILFFFRLCYSSRLMRNSLSTFFKKLNKSI